MKAFTLGFIISFPVFLVMLGAVLVALAQEVDNRAAAKLRLQWTIDKSHLLKVQAIHKRTKTQDCEFTGGNIVCVYSDKNGVQKVVAAR